MAQKIKWGDLLNKIANPFLKANRILRQPREDANLHRPTINIELRKAFKLVMKGLKHSTKYVKTYGKKTGGNFPAFITDYPNETHWLVRTVLKKVQYLLVHQGLNWENSNHRATILTHLRHWPENWPYDDMNVANTISLSVSDLQRVVRSHLGHDSIPICDSETAHRIFVRTCEQGFDKSVLDKPFFADGQGIVDMTVGSEAGSSNSSSSDSVNTSDDGSENAEVRLLDFHNLENDTDGSLFASDTQDLQQRIGNSLDVSEELLTDSVALYGNIAEASKAITSDYLLGPNSLAFLPFMLTLVSGDYVTLSLELGKILQIVGALKERGITTEIIAIALNQYLEDTIGVKDIMLDSSTVDALDEREQLYDIDPSTEDRLNGPMTRGRTNDINSYQLETGKSWKELKKVIPCTSRNWLKYDYRGLKNLAKEEGGIMDASDYNSDSDGGAIEE